jgi:hypothetical protein
MNSPDPAPAPAPPTTLPWYQSPVIVGAVALIVMRLANHLKTAYNIDLTVLGFNANDVAEYVIDALVTVGGAVIIWARSTQKHAPRIVLAPPKGDTVKKASLVLIASALAVLAASVQLSGCALITADSAAANAVQSGIELVTSIYIQQKGGGTPAGDLATAQQVKAVAVELQGVITGNLTIAQFNTAAQVYIAKLSPLEQIIATGLLSQIDIYFAQQVQQNNSILKAGVVAAANIVFNDVIAACAIYGA